MEMKGLKYNIKDKKGKWEAPTLAQTHLSEKPSRGTCPRKLNLA